ncbi:MAG: Rieske (2Fe-2S) protein [Kineosporiaceae bacterium]
MTRPPHRHPSPAEPAVGAVLAPASAAEPGESGPPVHRRSVIRAGALVVGVGAFGSTLAGCGSDPATGAAAASEAPSSAPTSAATSPGSSSAAASVQPTRAPSSPSTTAKAKPKSSRTTSEDDETSSTRNTSATTSKTTSKPATTTKKPTTKTSTKTSNPAPTDISLSQIPVGGAVVRTIKGRAVVLSRTGSNSVVGFDAHCTHAGCIVQASGGRLDCPCHGSAFDLSSGAVLQGPAASPLPRISVRVHDGGVSVG